MSREENGCSDLTSAIPYSWRLSELTPLFVKVSLRCVIKKATLGARPMPPLKRPKILLDGKNAICKQKNKRNFTHDNQCIAGVRSSDRCRFCPEITVI